MDVVYHGKGGHHFIDNRATQGQRPLDVMYIEYT